MEKTLRQAIREGVVKIGDKFEYYPGKKEKTIPSRKQVVRSVKNLRPKSLKTGFLLELIGGMQF